MKYKALFRNEWEGNWIFHADDDAKAWELARDFISKYSNNQQITHVDIEAIYEMEESGSIRELAIHKSRKTGKAQTSIKTILKKLLDTIKSSIELSAAYQDSGSIFTHF